MDGATQVDAATTDVNKKEVVAVERRRNEAKSQTLMDHTFPTNSAVTNKDLN